MIKKGIILAGGLGTRMSPITKAVNKQLLPIYDKPMIYYPLSILMLAGIKDILIIVNKGQINQFKKVLKNGKNFGVNIKYIEEQKPLGTIGSLGKIQYNGNEPILVINGDALTSLDLNQLINFHKKNKSYATLAVKEITSINPYGVVNAKGIKLSSFSEKPINRININTGIYVFSAESKNVLKRIKSSIDAPRFLMNLKKNNKKIIIFPIHENWEDIGDMQKYLEIKRKSKV